ncbi:hypothetical protein WN943_007188 [Citrus x changshan-huyou]
MNKLAIARLLSPSAARREWQLDVDQDSAGFVPFVLSMASEDLSGVHCSASEKPFSGLSGKGKVKANERSGK